MKKDRGASEIWLSIAALIGLAGLCLAIWGASVVLAPALGKGNAYRVNHD